MRIGCRFATILGIVLTLSSVSVVPLVAQDATPTATTEVAIYAPDAEVEGLTLAEWSARQWQWTLSFPAAINPLADETGETCGYGQSGSVFFLTGTMRNGLVERTCRVPAGVNIFVGLGGVNCSSVEPPPFFGGTKTELQDCIEAFIAQADVSQLEVTIDGQRIENLNQYQATTPIFTLLFPPDNIWNVEAGAAHFIAAGHQLIVAPLSPGNHEISIGGPDQEGVFSGVIYYLTVAAPQVVEPAVEATPAEATPVASS